MTVVAEAVTRAVAIAELDGPEVALAAVDRLDLGGYHAYHATRAEIAYLRRRRDQLGTR